MIHPYVYIEMLSVIVFIYTDFTSKLEMDNSDKEMVSSKPSKVRNSSVLFLPVTQTNN